MSVKGRPRGSIGQCGFVRCADVWQLASSNLAMALTQAVSGVDDRALWRQRDSRGIIIIWHVADHHGQAQLLLSCRLTAARYWRRIVLLDASRGSVAGRQVQVAEGDEARFFEAFWVKTPPADQPPRLQPIRPLCR